jgi:hypothetical protein
MPESLPNIAETVHQEYDGKWYWRILRDGLPLAASGELYDTEVECLRHFFAIFFGSYDESYVDLYRRWQTLSVGEPVPESYIHIKEQPAPGPKSEADGPNYEYDADAKADALLKAREESLQRHPATGQYDD